MHIHKNAQSTGYNNGACGVFTSLSTGKGKIRLKIRNGTP